MNNQKNDAYYIEKILTDLHFIASHMEGVLFDTLTKDVPWLIAELERESL